MQRRIFLSAAFGGIIAGLSSPVLSGAASQASGGRDSPFPKMSPRSTERARELEAALSAIEKSVNGRLGVAVLDLETGLRAGHRINERFPI